MVKCERAALILFIKYLQNRIYEKCSNAMKQLECVLKELDVVKDDIETKAITEIETEIYS